jgi:hypothetical protein
MSCPIEVLPSGAALVVGPCELALPAGSPAVFSGCLNHWGLNSYWRSGSWAVDIEQVRSASTCGSPIFAGAHGWVGFLRDEPGRVRCDGSRVVFEIPAGQELLVYEEAPRDDSPWCVYRNLADRRLVERPVHVPRAAHWTEWEYCTWVEQKAVAAIGQAGRVPLNESLVRQLAERILRLGLPPGKFTIDDGWSRTTPEGGWNDGYWQTDPVKFPDLPGLCDWLRGHGFTPGLWFGLPLLPAKARLRVDRPDLFGALDRLTDSESAQDESPWSLAPGPATEAYVRETLRPYAEMGFRKFKFDFYYGARSRMNALARTVHHAVRGLDPQIEIESHHPDFFFSRWIDSCRLNDVLIHPGCDWEGLTLAHMRVTALCAPDRIMNLDHLGGNDPRVGEADFLRHLALLDFAPTTLARHAVLSLLPDRFSPAAQAKVREFVLRHRGS